MAAITPGIQPQHVRMKTSRIAPHPLSITASGGNIIQRIALKIPISGYKQNDKDNYYARWIEPVCVKDIAQ